MGFTISEMVSRLNTAMLTKQSFYEVTIGGPGTVPDAPIEVMFNCSNISVPGINLGEYYDVRHGIGLGVHYPNAKSFTELNMTFYETEYAAERTYFAKWINTIYNPDSKRFGFFKDYTKTVTITQFNRQGVRCHQTQMLQAWVSNISQLDRGYAIDGVGQFNVNFMFSDLIELSPTAPAITKNILTPSRQAPITGQLEPNGFTNVGANKTTSGVVPTNTFINF